jgi:hypothetical protein
MTIYLYIKTHIVTGLKYLGKTQKNPHIYRGSGKYWRRHIKKHGNLVKTQILLATDCESELKDTGLFFSKMFNVVKSDDWANLTEECGNGISSNFSSELQKRRIKEGNMPQVFTKEKTLIHNKRMIEMGIHPSQRPELIRQTNEKMLRDGTHPFVNPIYREANSKSVKEYQLALSASNKHNFKNKVPVLDKNGIKSIISIEDYKTQQIGEDMSMWNYVTVTSNEAKRRRAPGQ